MIGASRYQSWGSLPSIPGELDSVASVLTDQGLAVVFTSALDVVKDEQNESAENSATNPTNNGNDLSVQTAELPSALLENSLWEAVRLDNTESSYQRYVERFPTGVFVGIANGRLTMLKNKREQQEAQAQTAQLKAREDEAKSAEKALLLSRKWRRGVQIGLNQAGFDVGLADGLWGARTREGIRQWQGGNGFVKTGYLNKTEYEQMVAELGVVEVEPPITVRLASKPEQLAKLTVQSADPSVATSRPASFPESM